MAKTTQDLLNDELEEKQIEETEEQKELSVEELKEELTLLRNKTTILKANLHSAYEKIRNLEKENSDRNIKEKTTDALVLQAVSVFSNTVNLAIKNKEN